MTTTKQMNSARKAVKSAATSNPDKSYLHRIAIESLTANGMDIRIVTEMAQAAMLDVILGY